MKIYLDSGHGGEDPGAVANGYLEKDFTLQISLYQKQRFEAHGIEVIMSRVDDVEPDLNDRMLEARSLNSLSISNHINAGGGKGFEVWKSVRFNTDWPEMIINEIVNLGIKSRGIKTKPSTKYPGYDYFAMNNTYPTEGIIVEYGFIDSDDINVLVNKWEEMAEAVVKATVEYLGIKYYEIGGNNMFNDINNVSDWAKESVSKLEDLGILKGDENNNFNPKSGINREEVAVLLNRLLQLFNK